MNRRTKCVFCGAADRKITKEHVWEKALRKHIENGPGRSVTRARIRMRQGEVVEEIQIPPEVPLDWQVKAPCHVCNEGWMEQVDKAAEPILIQMLNGAEFELDAIYQAALARWVTLKILVAQRAFPRGVGALPDHAYRAFYDDRSIAPTQIWTGRYGGAGSWPTDYHYLDLYYTAAGLPAPQAPNGYIVAFSVGYAAFFCHGFSDLRAHGHMDLGGRLSPFFVPIWPATAPVTWPPEGVLEADGLAQAIREFDIDGLDRPYGE